MLTFSNIRNMGKKTSELSKYKLKFEFTPIKAIKTAAIEATKAVKKVKLAPKKAKKLTKAEKEQAKRERNNVIMGIGQLLVFVSIAYSTATIFIGVDSPESRIALLPQAVFGLVILAKAFSKLYK